MRLLVLNANTSTRVTDLCVRVACQVARPDTTVMGATARFGAAIIESREQNAVGERTLLELLDEHGNAADAALIAVSYDTGLDALRARSDIPVVGMTEAALKAAYQIGERIGMATFGTSDLYRELAAHYDLDRRIAAIRVVDVVPAQAYANPASVRPVVRNAAMRLIDDDKADIVVLCGAALGGMSLSLTDLPLPVIDCIVAGTKHCESLQ